MNKIEMEKTLNELRGVASVLLMMSEMPKGDFQWQEWAFHNTFTKLEERIVRIEEIAEI